MNAKKEIAMMRLALDALESNDTPPLLREAAHRYVYEGKAEPFLSLLIWGAERLAARGAL